MEIVYFTVISLFAIAIGSWMIYDTYKHKKDNTLVPSAVYYIRGLGFIALGLYMLYFYFS